MLHFNKRDTNVLSSNFIQEIYIAFRWQYVLCSPGREFDAFNKTEEYKSKDNDVNHLKVIRKMNLNKFVVAHLNLNSVRNKFEALIQNVWRDRIIDNFKNKSWWEFS